MLKLKRTVGGLGLFVLLAAQAVFADVVNFDSPEGYERLARSHSKDFAKLSAHFKSQMDLMSCGPTTSVVVLNALRWGTSKAPLIEIEPNYKATLFDYKTKEELKPELHGYTVETFFNEEKTNKPRSEVRSKAKMYGEDIVFNKKKKEKERSFGFELEHLAESLRKGHHLNVEKRVVGTLDTEPKPLPDSEFTAITNELIRNLETENDYVIVNYVRAKIPGQLGGGHISPLGAYDPKTKSFLIMDVNPMNKVRAGWVWVDGPDLVAAMNTFDTNENRGYLLVSDHK